MKLFPGAIRSKVKTRLKRFEEERPGLFSIFCLALAAPLMIGHYAFGEWAFHPGLALWQEPKFWADMPGYAVLPVILWLGWKIISLGRLNVSRHLVTMTLALCEGDALFYFVFKYFKIAAKIALQSQHPVHAWHWASYWYLWTFWLPIVVIIGNIVFLRNWWRLFGSKFFPLRPIETGRKTTWRGVILKSLVVVTATIALLITALYSVLPQMPINDTTSSLAETFLVSSRLKGDFECLISNPAYQGKRLGAILDHVRLAASQRRQFYPNLDDETYQEYVLSPHIDDLPLEEVGWRRTLWKNFHPHVRDETNAPDAAEIIVRMLRERVGIDPSYHYRVGVETIWTQQMTDPIGFERIYVAALRSVGIAARLNAQNQAELWTGETWQAAPHPGWIGGFAKGKL